MQNVQEVVHERGANALTREVGHVGDLEQGLNERIERVAELSVRHVRDELAIPILDLKYRQRVGNDRLARAPVQVLLIDVIGEVHVGMRFIGQYPLLAHSLQDD